MTKQEPLVEQPRVACEHHVKATSVSRDAKVVDDQQPRDGDRLVVLLRSPVCCRDRTNRSGDLVRCALDRVPGFDRQPGQAEVLAMTERNRRMSGIHRFQPVAIRLFHSGPPVSLDAIDRGNFGRSNSSGVRRSRVAIRRECDHR